MKNKDEAFDMFKKYKTEVKNQKDKRIKVLRSDKVVNIFHKILPIIVRKID